MPIRLKDLSVLPDHRSIRGETPILNRLSCTFYDDEITLIIGQVGAGKSTLLDTIGSLRKPDEGAVYFNENPVWNGTKLNPKAATEVGMVFQAADEQLFAKTVLAEFQYSLRHLKLSEAELKRCAATALNSVGLSPELLMASPLYLSQGQKRRVALATTFAVRPAWLLLDEPTAGLDPAAASQFVDYLIEQKKISTGGMIVATHDLDTFLPLSQRVLVLKHGNIVADVQPRQLLNHPNLLHTAQIGLPSSVQLAWNLKHRNCPIQLESFQPEAAAEAIADMVASSKNVASSHEETGLDTESSQSVQRASAPSSTSAVGPSSTLALSSAPDGWDGLVNRLDPRSKWLAYILLSIATLVQSNWIGLGIAAVVTVGTVMLSRVKIWETLRLLTPFVALIIFSTAFAGIKFSGQSPLWRGKIAGFSSSAANVTLRHLFPFLLIMVLGMLLSASTSQLRMKQGLEQAMKGLRKTRIPVEAFSLATSLTLRFIPIIMEELQRFSRIAQSRQPRKRRRRGISLRDIPAMVIPLLLSILAIGDELATALEARGYRAVGQTRTRSVKLRFTRADWILVFLSLLISLMLLLFQF